MARHQELIKAALDRRLYDFIANHYWEFGKDELKDVILELIYAAFEGTTAECEAEAMQAMCDELKERWEGEFGEEEDEACSTQG